MSNSNASDDLRLVEQARAELPYIASGYAELMSRYQNLMRYVCHGILIDSASLDDVLQDIMLTVFHKLSGFEQRSSFKTWLMSITVNACISYNRKKLREREYISTMAGYNEEISAENEDLKVDKNEFEKMIQSLNQEERKIVTLKFVAELQFNEISELINVGLSATKMRYYRAIEKLKENF